MSFFTRGALRGFSAASCLPKSLIFCVGRRRSVSLCLYSRGQHTTSSHLRLNWGRDTPRYVVIWSFYGTFSNSCSPKCPKAQIIDQHKTYFLTERYLDLRRMIESYDVIDTDIPHAEQTETVQTLHFPWDNFSVGRTRVIRKPALYHSMLPWFRYIKISNEMANNWPANWPFHGGIHHQVLGEGHDVHLEAGVGRVLGGERLLECVPRHHLKIHGSRQAPTASSAERG